MNKRWKIRPEGSNWGDFGADDQLGRTNLLTEDHVLEAMKEVRTGRNFFLSMPLDLPGGNAINPSRLPPELKPVIRQGEIAFESAARRDNPLQTYLLCDDAVNLCIQHMAEPCLQGHGVMMDLRAHCGDERRMVGYGELMAIIKKDGMEVSAGDLVCLHTGFADRIVAAATAPDPEPVGAVDTVLDGGDRKLLNWISESGLATLISDSVAVEKSSSVAREMTESGPVLPLHEHCPFKIGVPLGELWYLSKLAAWLRENRSSRFFLTALPLRMPGAVGSPATSVATV